MTAEQQFTVGSYLAARLAQVGLQDYFVVPGDYNLVLLDELLRNPDLRMISCCNELNAGYAADGFARATGGLAAVVVTFSVGGLSVLNAVAGAFAEDLPVVVISGGPNTNSEAEYELLHHTLGKLDYTYQRDIFDHVTAAAMIVRDPLDAPRQIDRAIEIALRDRKPVYLEVACNIAQAPVSSPNALSFPGRQASNADSLKAAVEHAAELFNSALKPVLIAGVKLRSAEAVEAFRDLADAVGCAVAVMPNAKGLFDEQHPGCCGIYWGPVGSPGCGEIVESADLCLFAGATFTDYTTAGHAALLNQAKMIDAQADSVVLPGQAYNGVVLREFLQQLASAIKQNSTSLSAYRRIKESSHPVESAGPEALLTTRQLFARVQRMLDAQTCVVAETGDSWFNCVQLELPSGCGFEIQMQYGSIGWSVGATLGYCLGQPERRVISLVGDGSFQLTAQELSTMIRYQLRPIIFLINNGGYTIEVEIHDGPYNTIKNWNYAELIRVFNAADGNGWAARVATEGELDAAIASGLRHDGPVLIEVEIDRDDCSKNLLEWGSHVARNNGRPPRIQRHLV